MHFAKNKNRLWVLIPNVFIVKGQHFCIYIIGGLSLEGLVQNYINFHTNTYNGFALRPQFYVTQGMQFGDRCVLSSFTQEHSVQ